MKRQVSISTEEDLKQSWGDDSCPNMRWTFIEQTLDECLQEDGSLMATYETLEVADGDSLSFTYLTESGESSYTITAGEYGIKPSA